MLVKYIFCGYEQFIHKKLWKGRKSNLVEVKILANHRGFKALDEN